MKIFIVDASILLRTLSNKGGTADIFLRKLLADQKSNSTHLYSTSFLMIEVANGLRFSLGDEKFARDSLRRLSILPIRYIEITSSYLEEALRWSYTYKTTVYDSIYHVVAKMLDGTFLTCDDEYYQKAKSVGNIKLLS
ncbi:type II toxin-antitoxin system VapC family toxin [Candidatus Gottesmanbacteria bacterium]|nr:type II toxin-antitoxin system VapC family toxin [Candidatus Gottesmanbacteria bacterium]